jgi:probable HAF family extracellular repeat protein
MPGGQGRRAWRAVTATAMTLVAGIATPATAGAETGGGAAGAAEQGGTEPPRITVTEIQAPPGHTIDLNLQYEISDRGEALLNVVPAGDEEERPSIAVWHRGEIEVLWRFFSGTVDMSAQGHVVGVAPASDCRPSSTPNCGQPMLWARGESRPVPFGDPVEMADMRVSDRGHVVANLQRYDPTAPLERTFDLVAWHRHGEVVHAPVTTPHSPSAVNERGQVALTRLWTGPLPCGAMWQIGGTVTELGPCRFIEGTIDINRRGQVLGFIAGSAGIGTSYLWHDGQRNEIPSLILGDLSDRGDAVGSTIYPYRAVLWHDGTTVDLGSLGGSSVALAVNEHRQVVGHSTTADGESHAVLWQDGQVIDLGALAGAETSSTAVDINDRGQILGEVDGRPAVWTVHRR